MYERSGLNEQRVKDKFETGRAEGGPKTAQEAAKEALGVICMITVGPLDPNGEDTKQS